jgi:hypothetical protein
MKKHYGMLVFALASILPACGNADRESSLTTLSSSLRCATDDDCASGWACRLKADGSYCESETPNPPNPPASACSYDSDCAAGEECEHEHGLSYCKPHAGDDEPKYDDHGKGHDDPATPDGGVTACSDSDAYGHAECEDDHHGGHDDGKYDDDDSKGDEYEDRSGPNRGRH